MQTLGGHPSAMSFMTIRAEELWLSVPRDCGMSTGFVDQSCRYDPKSLGVSHVMAQWAEASQGFEPLPTCMEDSFCSACLAVYQELVR